MGVTPTRPRIPVRPPVLHRRTLLQSAAALAVLGCTTENDACPETPSETEGPYPGDGSNGPNVLAEDGVIRADLRPSLSSDAVADGIELTVTLTLVDSGATCGPLEGYAIYLWHCDAEGRYSLYSDGVTGDDYLRGVQVTDANGVVTFTTVFPGCYDGRWPHMHFEVYESAEAATSGGDILLTSQLALPEAACADAYADARYAGSLANLEGTSLSDDGVFGDDEAETQLAAVTGDAAAGFAATLTVGLIA